MNKKNIEPVKNNRPVQLILTYDNGRILEFDVERLVSMTTNADISPLGEVVKALEITLEYSRERTYNLPVNNHQIAEKMK